MSFRKTLIGLFAVLGLVGAAHRLAADFTPQARIDAYRGVSLEDLADFNPLPGIDNVSRAVLSYLERQRDLTMRKRLSVSLYDYKPRESLIVVDLFGRDRAFSAQKSDGLGGAGFMRVEVQFAPGEHAGLIRVLGHKLRLQRDLTDMKPVIRTSLGDRLAVLVDSETGYRRAFPLGVGSIDAVRFYPTVTVMTPTTEFGRLDKNFTIAKRAKPRYFRSKPFIPINVPVSFDAQGKPRAYRRTSIAFHIWQNPGFERGFLSHGCMRMRTNDLDELLELVQGVRDFIPTSIRMESVEGVQHPYPHLVDRHNAVKNYGTATRPVAKKVADSEGVRLTHTIKVSKAPPAVETLVGQSMDPAYGPVPGEAFEADNLP